MKLWFKFPTIGLLVFVPLVGFAQGLQLKEDSGDIRLYEGSVLLSGTYRVESDSQGESGLSGALYFIEDKSSHKKLPSNEFREGLIFLKLPKSDGDILRMFHIPEKRKKTVCGYQGTASLIIKDFNAVKAGSENGDMATLVKILSAGKPRPVPCQ